MIGFYVIMIAVLAMTAAVGYTIFSSVQTTNALSLAERNAARLEMTTGALRQVVIADAEGRLFVPMGVASITGSPTSRTALPAWVSGENVTPWGSAYAYCPYAPVTAPGGSAGTVYGGTNYAVTLGADPVIYGASRDYVLSGVRPTNALDVAGAPDVLAFLISPSNNATAVPACNSVYWDGRAWLTSGPVTGSVRAITVDSLSDSLARAPRLLRRHVIQGGTGTGLTQTEPASLSAVLTEWRYLRPHRLTIVLDDGGGPLLIDPALTDLGAGPGGAAPHPSGFGRHLILEAAPGDSPIINASTGSGTLTFPSDVTIDGVDFGSALGLSATAGSRLLIRNADLPSVDSGGGTIVLGAGVNVTSPAGSAAPPVRVSGGDLSVQGAVSLNATESGGSAIRQRGGRVHVAGPLTVLTGASSPLFEADGYGEVSRTLSGSLSMDGTGRDLDPYTRPARIESAGCLTGDLTCTATCPPEQAPLSGTCETAGVTNVFLRGTQISGSVFTCSWALVSETSPNVTDPSGPISPRATALCSPRR